MIFVYDRSLPSTVHFFQQLHSLLLPFITPSDCAILLNSSCVAYASMIFLQFFLVARVCQNKVSANNFKESISDICQKDWMKYKLLFYYCSQHCIALVTSFKQLFLSVPRPFWRILIFRYCCQSFSDRLRDLTDSNISRVTWVYVAWIYIWSTDINL